MLEIYEALLRHEKVGHIFQNRAARIENATCTYPKLFISGCGDPKWTKILPQLQKGKAAGLKKWVYQFLRENDYPATLFDVSVKHAGDGEYDIAIGFDTRAAQALSPNELKLVSYTKSRMASLVRQMQETPNLENAAEAVRMENIGKLGRY